MTGPSAKVLADSVSPEGIRLTSMEITMHRFVLAEFNTHRVFSRNFRSSRAVPVKKLLAEVRDNPAMPVCWRQNKPGMQAGEELPGAEQQEAEHLWRRAASKAADYAEGLMSIGLHKSWANRLLEPYLFVHGVVTSTDWANFYALRRHPDAQPEIKALADAMWEAQQASTPGPLQPGEWHLPYVTEDDWTEINGGGVVTPDQQDTCIKLSVARCARVSYFTHEGKKPTIKEDLALYERLVGSQPLHASPAEHQATPDRWWKSVDPFAEDDGWAFPSQHGNFRGWCQYRKTLPGECKRD